MKKDVLHGNAANCAKLRDSIWAYMSFGPISLVNCDGSKVQRQNWEIKQYQEPWQRIGMSYRNILRVAGSLQERQYFGRYLWCCAKGIGKFCVELLGIVGF